MRLESNPAENTITMRGPIGDFDGGISADDFLDVMKEHQGADVTIHLDSEGGSVTDGLSMFNAISRHEGMVTVHIDALAASIATVIAVAADRVIMNSNAKFMIHRAWTVAAGNCLDFRSMADLMEMMDRDIAESYADKTGADPEHMLALMTAETWMDAKSALEAGFVDEINNVSRKNKPEAESPTAGAANALVVSPFIKLRNKWTGRRMKLSLNKHKN